MQQYLATFMLLFSWMYSTCTLFSSLWNIQQMVLMTLKKMSLLAFRTCWNRRVNSLNFIGFGVTAVCYEEFSFSLILLFNFYGLRYTSVGILSSACFTFISIRAVSKIGSLISKVMRCVSKGNVPFGNRYCSPLILKSCLSTFFSLSSFQHSLSLPWFSMIIKTYFRISYDRIVWSCFSMKMLVEARVFIAKFSDSYLNVVCALTF